MKHEVRLYKEYKQCCCLLICGPTLLLCNDIEPHQVERHTMSFIKFGAMLEETSPLQTETEYKMTMW